MNITKLKKCSKNIKNIDPKMILSCYTNYSGNELGCMPPQVGQEKKKERVNFRWTWEKSRSFP